MNDRNARQRGYAPLDPENGLTIPIAALESIVFVMSGFLLLGLAILIGCVAAMLSVF